ncbi:MAG: hypothetical protein ABI587_00985 [Gemmatimonadales bacterium]
MLQRYQRLFKAFRCQPQQVPVVDRDCLIATIQAARDTVEGRRFGLLIERGGMFKFVNYANKLD